MGKRWIVLFVLVLMVVLVATAFAEKMVLVLDPGNPTAFNCYRVGSATPTPPGPPWASVTLNNVNRCSDDAITDSNLGMVIRDVHASPPNNGLNRHRNVSVPDGTTIYSNPCVTYWYHGHSYTVCN